MPDDKRYKCNNNGFLDNSYGFLNNSRECISGNRGTPSCFIIIILLLLCFGCGS